VSLEKSEEKRTIEEQWTSQMWCMHIKPNETEKVDPIE